MKSLYSQLRKEHLAEWRVWYNMCHNCKNNKTYYVETDVCEEWKGPEGFINWLDDIGPRPNDKYVLDRINKFADYEPGNVEWTTKKQNLDRSRFRSSEIGKYRKIAVELGHCPSTYYRRLRIGLTPKDAATMSIHPGKKLRDRMV